MTAARAPRVAHLMLKSTALVGGIETFVTKAFLAGESSAEGAHVAYCLRDAGGGSAAHRAPAPPWTRLPDAAGKLLVTPWALWRARRRDRAAVVHFHGFGASLWAPLAKALGLKVVSHSHGIEWERARWNGPYRHFLYFIAWVTCRFSDRVLVVSRKEADAYAARFGVRCLVVPGGFEGHRAPVDCRAPREKVVVVAGRPVPEKRILETVLAWNALDDHAGHTLRVYCGGNYGGGQLERIREACAAGRDVELMPFVTREEFLAALARSSHYVALSSLEGRSLAMLEALATGNALLVADTPENREFVPGEGNRFVPAGATAAELAAALGDVLHAGAPDAALRERNVRAGTSRSWADVRRDCEGVYASL